MGKKKILVVGGVAGGASAAARARRLDETSSIIVFEKGPHVSYSNCCLPYFLDRTIRKSDDLILMDPEQFRKKYNIEVRTKSEVVKIDRDKKTVTVNDLDRGESYEESYDHLILSPGARPVVPGSIKGADGENVFTVRNVVDIAALDAFLHEKKAQNVVVTGGGFIGCEITESLVHAGYHVALVESQDQILSNFDPDMVQILHKELLDNGVDLKISRRVTEIRKDAVVLENGEELPSDAVVMAAGMVPESELARNAGLEIGSTGGIKVDSSMRTSDPFIYAVGDAAETVHLLTKEPLRLALAWPAQMQARAAADDIYGIRSSAKGYIGSSVTRVFSQYAASTGLSEKEAQKAGFRFDAVWVIPSDKVSLMPGSRPIHLKLIFEVPTGRLLGAQSIAPNSPDRRVDVIAALIGLGGTVDDLKLAELCYAPVVGTAKDAVHMAALVAENLLAGRFKQVPLTKVRQLVEEKACIIDVREEGEFAAGHLIGSVNIPLSQLRQRTDEIPKDRPIYLHCRSSQRSYNAVMALNGLGFGNVHNISGSYLAVSIYEAMQERLYGKKKIVTEYNFK